METHSASGSCELLSPNAGDKDGRAMIANARRSPHMEHSVRRLGYARRSRQRAEGCPYADALSSLQNGRYSQASAHAHWDVFDDFGKTASQGLGRQTYLGFTFRTQWHELCKALEGMPTITVTPCS